MSGWAISVAINNILQLIFIFRFFHIDKYLFEKVRHFKAVRPVRPRARIVLQLGAAGLATRRIYAVRPGAIVDWRRCKWCLLVLFSSRPLSNVIH